VPVVRIGNYDINYIDEGEGIPVLLIHGLAGDVSAWAPQIAWLRNHYRVVAFDNRGAGLSTQVDEPITTADLAKDTIGLMEKLKLTNAHVIGRSMGGAVAQIMAITRPELVRTLVLCASFAKLDPIGERVLTNMRQVLEWRGNWADHAHHSVQNFVSHEFFNRERERVARIESLIGGETRLQACYIQQNFACLAHDTLSQLSRITCPTLIMGGANDPICSPTCTQWMADGIRNSKLVTFDGCSHFFLMEQAEKFMTVLANWLSQHS
jgi:pimeloyl-ACP methyl ester carboxylesterase